MCPLAGEWSFRFGETLCIIRPRLQCLTHISHLYQGLAMSNLGVFHWIRESVRRSVLLGFSDAVEQLGTPEDGHEISPQLAAVLRSPARAIEHTGTSRTAARAERKRLGRSLDNLRTPVAVPAGANKSSPGA